MEHIKLSNPSDHDIARRYELHKQLHTLAISVIKAVNRGETNEIESYLKKLDEVTIQLIKTLNF